MLRQPKRLRPAAALAAVGLGVGLWAALPTPPAQADEDEPPAVVGEEAPDWEVNAWANLPDGVDALEVDDFAGKTIYLYCFQSW